MSNIATIMGMAVDSPGPSVGSLFSTDLYDGTGANQTITNGINLAGQGGLVWIKSRSNAFSHYIYDTERGTSGGAGYYLATNSTIASTLGSVGKDLYQFNSDGFELGPNFNAGINNSGYEQVSWTFRKAPKFFDVVTYTGNGNSGGRYVSHNLGTTIGFIMIKRTDSSGEWVCGHRSTYAVGRLNSTAAWSTSLTSGQPGDEGGVNLSVSSASQFFVNNGALGVNDVNASGGTYVAYLFAHNDGDGGFGPTGDQDIIKCGSYTGNASTDGPEINLGWEPQWLFVKATSDTGGWGLLDNMRGFDAVANEFLYANTTGTENSASNIFSVTSTGFKLVSSGSGYNSPSGTTYIYIAIRKE